MDRVLVQLEDFDVASEISLLKNNSTQIGAVVLFLGVVRGESNNESITHLELEHYAPMVDVVLNEIVADAKRRWSLQDVTLIHRVGHLDVGENVVLVAVSSKHRQEAFLAAEYMMNCIKTKVPIWKKETTKKGERWLEF